MLGDVTAGCCQESAIAICAEVLPGIEAEAADVTQAAGAFAAVNRAVGLRRIFDDRQ